MKRAMVIALVTIASMTAFAGKQERDLMTKEVQPAAKETMAKWKGSCGCALAITIDDSYKTMDDLRSAKHLCEAITEAIPKYCTDDASKKAMCQMKTLVMKTADKVTFSFKGGTGTATSHSNERVSWEMITRELDK